MKILDFNEGYNRDITVALGYFDSVHLGHQKLISCAEEISKLNNSELSVFTFDRQIKGNKDIFTFEERLVKFDILNVQNIVLASFNEKFKSLSAQNFLDILTANFNVKCIVCGFDYTYGYNKSGNITTLKEYCEKKNIELKVVDEQILFGKKISSSLIKDALLCGNISLANNLLGDNYFVSGKVIQGKKLGRTIGFPTANLAIDDKKFLIKEGVYLTAIIIDGKLYSAITNYGTQPTVNGNNIVVESYINNFSGDLYGKYLTVYFVEYIRNIKKYNNLQELIDRLNKDKELLK